MIFFKKENCSNFSSLRWRHDNLVNDHYRQIVEPGPVIKLLEYLQQQCRRWSHYYTFCLCTSRHISVYKRGNKRGIIFDWGTDFWSGMAHSCAELRNYFDWAFSKSWLCSWKGALQVKYLVKFDWMLLEIIFFETFVIRERQKTWRKEEERGSEVFGREDKSREI